MRDKPAVLLVEEIHPKYLELLKRRMRVVRPRSTDENTLAQIAAAAKVSAILIRTRGCVSKKVIQASPNLRVIGRHGIGLEHIDIAAATRAGIWVVYTPAGSRISVAEHTWSMILNLARRALPADAAVRRGDFKFRDRVKALELRGKTLGIIGLGRIGTTVAEIGVRGFGMRAIYHDIVAYPKKERALNCRRVSLRTLLSRSDVVALHVPLDKSTRGMIGARELKLLQPHALLVNCARGAVLDTVAVARALQAGKLGGAGIDVFDPEPPPLNHPLLKCANAILSPHFAAQTPEANLGYAAVVDDILAVLSRKRPKWPANEIG